MHCDSNINQSMIQLREQYWAVEVPEGATDFTIVDHKVCNVIDERDMKRIEWNDVNRPTRPFWIIPYGTWQIVCTSKEVTEEQAAGLVEEHRQRYNLRYKDYTRGYMWRETALLSLHSLLTSKGCDLNKTYLILKKL